ncbi:MAG: hypothetical protein PHU36_08630 [Syntrophomonadaceae bacterium]|nr:hypothetical protein [Syntrophomonadaceae bacterium]
MRSESVVIAGQNIVIREMKIKDIKEKLLPKLESAWGVITSGEITDLIENLGGQAKEIFPELADINIEECYPSEIEAFVEAWINVNFTGIKRLFGQLLSLVIKDKPESVQGLEGLLGSRTTGKS